MHKEDVHIIETTLKVRLPDYYKDFLLNYPYKLTRVGLELESDDIFSPESSDLLNDPGKLIEVNKDLQDSIQYWENDNIIIGIDWCGDFFFLDLSVPLSPVYYYDHETDDSTVFMDTLELFVDYVYEIFREMK
ncbi:MAG TPA: SMI1/KNR4 family protein [Bacillota bacterium]|nr:SMI1/KNR4 family protein [Bacillota bacterium]